jgi:BR serine/threonine kinase
MGGGMGPSPDPRAIGPYEIERTIGAGASSRVFLAHHKDTRQRYALKCFPKSPDGSNSKIHREIALHSITNHPNVLRLFSTVETATHICLVLELAERGELFDLLLSRKVFTETLAVAFFRGIVLGVEYLHSLGICHRDLKSENVLLDLHYQVKIADFGFAAWMPEGTATDQCGSAHYMAPEVVAGGEYDPRRADVWSLGIILFTLVSVRLRQPFITVVLIPH